MVSRYLIASAALHDLVCHAEYLERVAGAPVADRFLTAAEETFEFLAEFPTVGARILSRFSKMAGMRRWPVNGFRNHIIYYRQSDKAIRIMHVYHGAQSANPS